MNISLTGIIRNMQIPHYKPTHPVRAPSSGRKYESLQIFHNNFPFRYLYEKRNRFALKSFFCKIWPIDILHLDGSKMVT